jgi:hypothetical protein
MVTHKQIKITELEINSENYRYDPVGSQRDAIEKMLSEQWEKVLALAKHIIENGMNPNDAVQVAPSGHNKSKYLVVEGNRRVIALKILHNPEIIDFDGYSSLKKQFKILHDANKGKLFTDVDCTVYDTPTEADKWIKLKHAGELGGAGTVSWNPQQIQRFDEKTGGKSSIAMQALKLLDSSPDVAEEIKKKLPSLKITNLDRLISDPDVRAVLGININKGILQSDVAKEEVVKGLTSVAKDLLDPGFKVQDIYTKDDRAKYISRFPKSNKPNTNTKAPKPWQFNGTSALTIKSGPKAGSKKERKSLIPSTCVLSINNPKLDAIYRELKKLHVEEFKNAVSVLFRVFVELSMDCFIESNKPPKVTIDSSLQHKVGEVSLYLEKNNFANKQVCKGIRTAVATSHDVLGANTWNAYVHNPKFSPNKINLMTGWDNIQEFMEKVWENIK